MKKQAQMRFFAGVFLIAGSVMMTQILQSRLFSVTTWYHLSFLVISIAMFGLTIGALHVYRGDIVEQRRYFGEMAAKASINASLWTLVALGVQLFIPLVSSNILFTFLVLPAVAIPVAMPYYFAGIALTAKSYACALPSGKNIWL